MAKPDRHARHAKMAGPTEPKKKRPPRYMPTPDEIKAGCMAIRSTWTDAEHYRRAGLDPAARKWTPPEVSEPVLD
jgi:hypothetical protein